MKGGDAVRLTGVSKAYQLYSKPEDRLKQLLFGRFKTFHKEFWALSGIDLAVRKGESVALVGRNGAGKSTLLQIVTSILQPTSGTVEVQGRIAPLLQLGTSFNPEFTGNENIDLSANILGLGGDEIEDVRGKIIQFADIGEFIHQPVRTYSSGMFARLAFAVAAHVRADILIVDEVLSVGDIGFTQKCTRFLREFREQGTLLFVSHDVGAVLSLCDRAVWLDKGRIVEDALPKRIIPHYSAWIANPDKTDARTFVENVREKLIEDPAGQAAPQEAGPIPSDARNSFSRPSAQPRTHMDFSAFKAGTRDFGEMNGTVTDAWIENTAGERLGAAAGGEVLSLCIECEAKTDLDDIIVGFTFMDRLGVNVFSWDSSKEAKLVGRPRTGGTEICHAVQI